MGLYIPLCLLTEAHGGLVIFIHASNIIDSLLWARHCERHWRVKGEGDIVPALRTVRSQPPLLAFFPRAFFPFVLGQFIHELLSFMEESSVTGGKVSLSLSGSLLWLYIRILGAAFKTHWWLGPMAGVDTHGVDTDRVYCQHPSDWLGSCLTGKYMF